MPTALGRFINWMVPTPPVVDARHAQVVQRQLWRQAAHLAEVVAVMSLPTIVLFVGLLWAHADHVGLLAWAAVVTVNTFNIGYRGHAVVAETDRADGDLDRVAWPLRRAHAVGGAVWGSIALLGMPDAPTWQAVLGIIVIATMAVNAIFSAPVAGLFWPFQILLVSVASLGLLRAGTSEALGILAIVAYALPFSGVLARINRTSATTAAYYAVRSQHSAAQLEAANAGLAHEASHDPLTGMANRAAFIERLDRAMERAPARVGVLFMDLDQFKIVNDSLGHHAGDELLRAAADRIANRLRPSDHLARLGGDEFTVLVTDIEGDSDLEGVATRILNAFDEPFRIGGRACPVGVSIGLARATTDLSTGPELLRAADAALYEAKAAGRGVIREFDAGLRDRIDRRRADEEELREALRTGQIRAWFQPIVELATGRIVAAEALARWVTEAGVRTAGSFIEVAVEAGLEGAVSLESAGSVRELRERLDEWSVRNHRRIPDISVGLNLPPASLNQLLDDLGLEGDLRGLTVEITERGVITDLDGARRRLEQLRARGAAVWLDDFGRGQSSLSLVTDLPLDGVKIDRSFVADMLTSREARTIVIAIAEIGRCLGLDVIAEGVETEEQVAALGALGVSHIQGYLVSQAVDLETFLGLVRNGSGWTPPLGAGAAAG